MDKRAVKKGINADDTRRRREASMTSVRKERKDEGLSKRRNISGVVSTISEPPENTVLTHQDGQNIPGLVLCMNSPDPTVQLDGLRRFRRLLSAERNPPVEACIKSGAVPLIVEFLKRMDFPELQFEAAWALTNIASTSFTSTVVAHNALPLLVLLLSSPIADVREQCAWCLGNVAGDGAELRNLVLSQGALQPLLANIAQPASLSLLRNCAWTLSNFCRGKPSPPMEALAPAYPVLGTLLGQSVDQETCTDAMWALSYLSDGDDARISAVAALGVIPCLINSLKEGSPDTSIIPALRILGNIVSGNDQQTQAVVDSGVLPALCPLLKHPKKNIRKESCWLLSNVAAGSSLQLSQLVNTPGLVAQVLEQTSSGSEWDVRKEAAWVIANIASGGNKVQLMKLIEYGAVKHLCDLLDVGDARVLLISLDALTSLLKTDVHCVQLVDEAEGIEKLEKLQEHESEEVYTKAVKILEAFFGGEEEGDMENIAPLANANTFAFAAASSSKNVFDFNSAQAFGSGGDVGLFHNGL